MWLTFISKQSELFYFIFAFSQSQGNEFGKREWKKDRYATLDTFQRHYLGSILPEGYRRILYFSFNSRIHRPQDLVVQQSRQYPQELLYKTVFLNQLMSEIAMPKFATYRNQVCTPQLQRAKVNERTHSWENTEPKT